MSERLTFPLPIWRKEPDGTVLVRYANDNTQYALHQRRGPSAGDLAVPEFGYGWSAKAIITSFPKAVHGPKRLSRSCAHYIESGEPCLMCAEPQSLVVNNAEELERALANGWSLRPVGTEVNPDEGPVMSPDFAPHQDDLEAAAAAIKPRRGRPKLQRAG